MNKKGEAMNAQTHYDKGLSHYLLKTPKKDVSIAIKHFEEAVAQEHPDAHFFLGRFYGLGDGVTLDVHQAMDYYHQGLRLGSHKCGYALGMLYYSGFGVDKDENRADDYFKQNYRALLLEAETGDPVSMHLMGTYYYYGFYVQRYIYSAIEWFLKASERGYSDAQYMLGMIYETIGENPEQKEKAYHYYELAAKQGHPYAQYALGILAIENEDYHYAIKYLEMAAYQQYALAAYTLAKIYHEREPKNPKKAFDWFLVAAQQNHVEACYYVGLYYHNGRGVKQDLKLAIYWYEKAAMKDDRDALYHLAMILMKEPNQDFSVIFKLLERAALLNHPNAQYNLAVMYQKGDGVTQNEQLAFQWYEKAANQDLAIAQYNLGMLYFEGRIVEKDEIKAKALWQKAADQNFEPAVKLMYSINNYEKLQKSPWQS